MKFSKRDLIGIILSFLFLSTSAFAFAIDSALLNLALASLILFFLTLLILALWDLFAKSRFSFTALAFILVFILLFTSIPQIFLLILFFSLIAFDIAKLRSFKAFIYYSLAIVLFAIFWQLAEIFEEYGILFEAIAVVSFAFFAFYYPFLKVRRAV